MSKRMQYWSGHLAAIAAEGITTIAYAKREGLSSSALYYWRKHLKNGAAKAALTASPVAVRPTGQFVPVQISDVSQAVRCSLTVAPGVRLELGQLPDPGWLAALGAAVSRQVR